MIGDAHGAYATRGAHRCMRRMRCVHRPIAYIACVAYTGAILEVYALHALTAMGGVHRYNVC